MSPKAIIATLPVKLKQDREDEVYRDYVTRNLRLIAENTGKHYTKEYSDIINPQPVDNRSAEEIIEDVISKTGIEVIQ
ncbi:MAG: hypothetical protein J6S71_03050 [Clostridia bacterium]|nr:hypothetical protein [Clostridia bacterium]